MKGVQIVEPNKLQIVDLEKPQIDKENNVLVRMVAAGICGSDVGIYHGTNAAATYPRIIGHENVGIVEEIGEGVTRWAPASSSTRSPPAATATPAARAAPTSAAT